MFRRKLTSLTFQDKGSVTGRGKRFFFLFPKTSRPILAPTQPSIEWLLWAFSSGVKRPGREANHSTLPYPKVKNKWSCSSTPSYLYEGRRDVFFLLYFAPLFMLCSRYWIARNGSVIVVDKIVVFHWIFAPCNG